MNKIPLRKITLGSLKVGMHVTKLDISWIDSPFLTHSRRIKSEKDIVLLKKAGVKNLIIDPNKGLDVSQETPKKEPVKQQESSAEKEAPQSEAAEAEKSQPKEKALAKEIENAVNIRNEVKKYISSLHQDLNSGNAIKAEAMSPLIEQTFDSLERHNQALLNLVHLNKRSQKLADHTFSTFCLALGIAQAENLAPDDAEALGIAALIHEAGWNQIPIGLMGKRSSYSPTELKLIERHVEIGVRSLSKSEIPELSVRIVQEHHELCNGSGYPQKLNASQIHPLSKLFSVIDRYDELVHQLNDKPGMLPTNALRKLYVDAEREIYDPKSVSMLIGLLGIYPISSAVKLNTGEIALVREVPSDKHLNPLVEVHIDAQGKAVEEPYFIDLADEESNHAKLSIESLIDPSENSTANLVLDLA